MLVIIARVFNTIMLPLLILLLIVNFIIIDENTYLKGYEKYEISSVTGISRDGLKIITDNTISYLSGKRTDFQIDLKVHGSKRAVYNERELMHMIDVKWLVVLSKYVLLILIVLVSIGYVVMFRGRGLTYILNSITQSSLFSLIILPAAYMFAPKDFYSNFVVFHKVLFTNDLWILNEKTDILLQLHPLNFFLDIGVKILVIYIIINIAILCINGIISMIRKENQRNKRIRL